MVPTAVKRVFLLAGIFLLGISIAFAAGAKPVKISPKERCPVCGMFVAKYPDFAAQIQLVDGSTVHFDGAKDMFKYHLDLPRYAPGKKTSDIGAIFVTDYYTLTPVDGRSAYYVTGSDVLGPMGRELIPFAKQSEARDFMTDHKGKSLFRFQEVTRSVIGALD